MTTAPTTKAGFKLPRKSPASKARAGRILKGLYKHYPDAHCELDYRNPHELLVATVLSAQATDVGVNKATPKLFAAFPTPADYARAGTAKIEPYVRSLGFFHNKAKAIHEAMKTIIEDFDGEVPNTMEDLLKLRGVARKTANVVLGNAFGINVGVVVDTHVIRISRARPLDDAQPPAHLPRAPRVQGPRGAVCRASAVPQLLLQRVIYRRATSTINGRWSEPNAGPSRQSVTISSSLTRQ
jgi:endonuclease III